MSESLVAHVDVDVTYNLSYQNLVFIVFLSCARHERIESVPGEVSWAMRVFARYWLTRSRSRPTLSTMYTSRTHGHPHVHVGRAKSAPTPRSMV